MQHLFESAVYALRRKKLAETLGEGKILIAGNGNSPINYAANYYTFRQDSNFLYYAGLDMPGLNLVIDCSTGEATLFGREATMEDVVWTGPQPTLAELGKRIGIFDIQEPENVYTACKGSTLHCLPPYRTEHFSLLQKVTEHSDCSTRPSRALIEAVIAQREIKEDREIEQIETALGITHAMHVKAMQVARAGIKESVIAGVAEGVAIAHECRLAYGAIVTKDGHILHNHGHHNMLDDGDLVLCDMGSENVMRYASDVTRTFPVSGKFTQKQRDIYEIVLKAEVDAINASKAGVEFREAHLLAARIITDGLKDLGLMKGDTQEAVAVGAHALFFPHGLGHQIGLDVHDMEGLGEDLVGYGGNTVRSEQFGTAYLRMGKALKEGHVVTVEPGIYFIPELISQWGNKKMHEEFINYTALEAYLDFGGIRIEDNVLVTSSGPKILGPSIPKSVAEIEHVMGS